MNYPSPNKITESLPVTLPHSYKYVPENHTLFDEGKINISSAYHSAIALFTNDSMSMNRFMTQSGTPGAIDRFGGIITRNKKHLHLHATREVEMLIINTTDTYQRLDLLSPSEAWPGGVKIASWQTAQRLVNFNEMFGFFMRDITISSEKQWEHIRNIRFDLDYGDGTGKRLLDFFTFGRALRPDMEYGDMISMRREDYIDPGGSILMTIAPGTYTVRFNLGATPL